MRKAAGEHVRAARRASRLCGAAGRAAAAVREEEEEEEEGAGEEELLEGSPRREPRSWRSARAEAEARSNSNALSIEL